MTPGGIRSVVGGLLACLFALQSVSAANGGGGPALPGPAAAFVERALPDGLGSPPSDGRALFAKVLGSTAFVSGSAGPFDVHVFVGDALRKEKDASRLLADLLEALQPAADLVARRWPAGGGGLISAVRLPIVIVDPGKDGSSYTEILSLLDHCEQLRYSGWAPANAVDTAPNRDAEVARTWEVQVFNLAHPTIASRRDSWVSRGVGYYALAFVANRALRQGSWGLVPPWLANGLIDELDIAAYGQAWVGQESWIVQTPGWFRPGWSGFVPQGARPPAPITGPPADLATTVKNTGDPWLDFKASRHRHWSELVVDRRTEAPASFVRAAETESFLPRDRAAARCLLSLMLDVAPDPAGTLTSLLDRPVQVPADGMPDSDPLPVIFARALGGVPEVDRLEALSTRDLLTELDRGDLAEHLGRLGADELLDLSDHRKQSRWLYQRSRFDRNARIEIFTLIMEIEYAQQMAEWKALSPRLDRGLQAALEASSTYPSKERDVSKVAEAFRTGLVSEPTAPAEDDGSSKRKKRGSSKSRR